MCDADGADFGRQVIQRGAYEKLTAPVNMPQLRLALLRAYEFRLAEAKLENFLSQETASEHPRSAARRKVRPSLPAAVAAPRPAWRTRSAPSRLVVGFVLGCVLFFAGLVAVRTIRPGVGDTLASAGFAADSGAAPSPGNAVATEPHSGSFDASHIWPLPATADLGPGAFDPNSAQHLFRGESELPARAVPHSSLPGYEPAAIVERVTPRYSLEARAQHLQGTVRIRALIGKDGVPRRLARVIGDPILAQIAMDAIALWRYAPATIGGERVESETIIPIDFPLPD